MAAAPSRRRMLIAFCNLLRHAHLKAHGLRAPHLHISRAALLCRALCDVQHRLFCIRASHAIPAQSACDRRSCPSEQETIESGTGQRQHRGPLHIPDIVAEADASGDDNQQAEQVRACRISEQRCSARHPAQDRYRMTYLK